MMTANHIPGYLLLRKHLFEAFAALRGKMARSFPPQDGLSDSPDPQRVALIRQIKELCRTTAPQQGK